MGARKVKTAPRKRPTQERSREMVETILEATARVLVKDGFERTTTNRVAEAAGVSVGSLYQYFPSKEALVATLVERACPAQTPAMVTTGVDASAVTWSRSLCLRAGAQVVTVDGTVVPVATPGGAAPVAYRLQLEGSAQQPTVRVFVASSDPNPDPAAFAVGTHPVSDDGQTWSLLGVFAAPRTGVVWILLVNTDRNSRSRCGIT